jgi:hypothetical protein
MLICHSFALLNQNETVNNLHVALRRELSVICNLILIFFQVGNLCLSDILNLWKLYTNIHRIKPLSSKFPLILFYTSTAEEQVGIQKLM